MSRRSAIQSVYLSLSEGHPRTAYNRGKREMIHRGSLTIVRKNAFLDLQAAERRGDDLDPYLERYREAVQRRLQNRKSSLRP